MPVAETLLAEDSRLHALAARGDFLDCYTVSLGRPDMPMPEVPIQEIAQRIFIGLPCWIEALLAARNLGVTPFGLKTTAELAVDNTFRSTVRTGEAINFLRVFSVAENEVILGEDDRHLDFRIAVHRSADRPDRISLATWVRTHNALGAVYLRTILPFHVLIVRARLRALAAHFGAR